MLRSDNFVSFGIKMKREWVLFGKCGVTKRGGAEFERYATRKMLAPLHKMANASEKPKRFCFSGFNNCQIYVKYNGSK